MKIYTAELISAGSQWILHTRLQRAGSTAVSEGWTRHPSVDDAYAFLDDLCLRLGATIACVGVVGLEGEPVQEQDRRSMAAG
jgi:hypothetical protein